MHTSLLFRFCFASSLVPGVNGPVRLPLLVGDADSAFCLSSRIMDSEPDLDALADLLLIFRRIGRLTGFSAESVSRLRRWVCRAWPAWKFDETGATFGGRCPAVVGNEDDRCES